MTEPKDRANNLVKAVTDKYGSFAANLLGNCEQSNEFLSTGSFALDDLLGKGLPCGRLVEISGWESVGKSTLAASCLGAVQRAGGLAVLLDTEHSYRAEWASWFGIDPQQLVTIQPGTMEQVSELIPFMVEFLRKDSPDIPALIVWDSVAATPLQKEVDGEFTSKDVGLHARVMSALLRRLTNIAWARKVGLLFINQLRERPMGFGAGETKICGHAIDFYAACLIRVSRTEIKPDRIRCKGHCTKNKVATPFKTRAFDIVFDQGIDDTLAYLDYGVETKIIDKKGGGWYDSMGHKFRQGDPIPEIVRKKLAERIKSGEPTKAPDPEQSSPDGVSVPEKVGEGT